MHRRSFALEGTFDECRTRRAHKRVLLPVQEPEPRSRGIPKGPGTYATAYTCFNGNFAKVKDKAVYEVALRGQVPRGVSSDHVLSKAFGDAPVRT